MDAVEQAVSDLPDTLRSAGLPGESALAAGRPGDRPREAAPAAGCPGDRPRAAACLLTAAVTGGE